MTTCDHWWMHDGRCYWCGSSKATYANVAKNIWIRSDKAARFREINAQR